MHLRSPTLKVTGFPCPGNIRFFGKFISTLIIFIGFLMIGLTKKRQGLHDKITAPCVP